MSNILILQNWNDHLELFKFEQKDIYFTEEYVKLYENGNNKAECFIFAEENNVFLFPYLKTQIPGSQGNQYDIESAYGYGGPLVNSSDDQFCSRAWHKFYDYCSQNMIVCGFVRFHPLLKNHVSFQDDEFKLNSIHVRKTVALNLELPSETIWNMEIHSKHRNTIRLAEKNGLRFVSDDTLENIDEFIIMYNKMIKAICVDDLYFFESSYYQSIKDNLRNKCFLGLIYLNNTIVSAAIFFYYGIYGHYHLAGSLEEYQRYGSNNLLLYRSALYLKSKGIKMFHLGGGTSNDESDSLYKFKKRFSKTLYDFYIGTMVFNKRIYDEICGAWEKKYPEKIDRYGSMFLKYRY
ncbi:MAG: GNAT family N-acetyltransferase [bacterium]